MSTSGYLNLERPLRSSLLKTYSFQPTLADFAALWLYLWLLVFTFYEGVQDKKERDTLLESCDCKTKDRIVYLAVLIIFFVVWSVFVILVYATKWYYLK